MRTFFASCALALAAPALAGPVEGTIDGNPATLTRHLDISDLDLASAAGIRALRHRLGDTVDALCTEAVGVDNGSADSKFALMRCRKSALNEAGPQVDRLLAAAGTSPGPGSVAVAVSVAARR